MRFDSIVERIRYRQEHSVDPEAFLRDVGAIRPADGSEQLRFTPEFASRLKGYVGTFREEGVDSSVVARIFGVDESQVEVADRPYTAFKVIHTVRNWPSAAALVFDAAADAALRVATDRWDEVPPGQRYRMLQSLRSFQDTCFFCDGRLEFSTDPVESCCSDRWVLTLHCDDCGRRFLEFSTEQRNTAEAFGNVSAGG